MLLYNLKIIIRNIFRNRLYSVINIIGLSLGFTGTILIMLWVWNEFDYDRFHENAENIYLLINKNTDDQGNSVEYVESPAPMSDYLVNTFPEIKTAARVEYFYRGGLIQKGNEFFKENGAAVDDSFFEIFSFEFLKGSKTDLFKNSDEIVISESLAIKYFKNDNALGKILQIKGYGDNFKTVEVSGVFKDLPDNSSIRVDFLIPFKLEEKYYLDNWQVSIYATFLLLEDDSKIDDINNKVMSIYTDVIGDDHFSSYIFPLVNLHLNSDIPFFNNSRKGNIKLLCIMILIAALILLIAVINYINLSTARVISKAKEISIKRILGISRIQIINSYFIEALFFSVISFQVALIFVEILRPTFNKITGQVLTINYYDLQILIAAVVIILITGFLSIIYPLISVGSFKPVQFLRNSLSLGNSKPVLRKLLVIFQFVISIILMIYSGVIMSQIKFIYSKDLGFDKENIILFNSSDLNENAGLFKHSLLSNPNVQFITLGDSPIGGGWPDDWLWEGKNGASKLDVNRLSVDEDYLKTLDIDLLQGRFFTQQDSSNKYIVINKRFADIIGLDDLIGRNVYLRDQSFEIIGITDNFYAHHFSSELKPVAFFKKPSSGMLIKINNDDYSSVIPFLKTEYEKIVEDRAFEYITLEEKFDNLYVTELRVGRMITYFSVLAILISCLGLFATSMFVTEQKTKEIGVRKVLGATSLKIIQMLNYDYLKLVGIAYLIAFPIAYFLTTRWIQNFVYKTGHIWWIFIVPGVVAVFISYITISWQTIIVARKNPVESLRYE